MGIQVIRLLFLIVVLSATPELTLGQLQEADNIIEIEVDGEKVTALLSPDASRAVWARSTDGTTWIFVSQADGSMPTRLTSTPGNNVSPHWLGDGSRIVFCGGNGIRQIWAMAADGKNLKQLTDVRHGCRMLVGGPGGLVAWQELYEQDGKIQPADVVAVVNGQPKRLVEKRFITDMAFDQLGSVLAVGAVDNTACILLFKDLVGDEDVEINFRSEDERLFAHGAYNIHWSPEGDLVSCRIRFLGGREGDVEIYGDKEIFVISKEGKFTAYADLATAKEIHEWIPETK